MKLFSLLIIAALPKSSASVAASVSNHDGDASSPLTFTSLTRPLPLFPGEVTNTWHSISIPNGPIAISEFAADVVEKDVLTGEIIPVPLSEAYLHHHVVFSQHKFYAEEKPSLAPMMPNNANSRGVGFGAGTESRGTRQKFPHPFRFTTVDGEDELLANVHVINTRAMAPTQAHHCLECPCTSEDHVIEDGHETATLLNSVVERKSNWHSCNSALVDEENTSCFPNTYYGGLYCCEHGEFCLDDFSMPDDVSQSKNEKSVYYLRYTVAYTPKTPEVRSLYLAACCDASGDEFKPGNIEYDVPKCDDDDGVCVHELETVQTLHGESRGNFGTGGAEKELDTYVDVVYMVGHLHRGGISMSSFFMNGTTLCESFPTYGTGQKGEIGNEPGYINSMSACTFDPPLRMKTTDKIRVVGKYDASEAHTGVMSLFYIAIADVDEAETVGSDLISVVDEVAKVGGGFVSNVDEAVKVRGEFSTHSHSFIAFVAVSAATGVAWYVATKMGQHRNYESIPDYGFTMDLSV